MSVDTLANDHMPVICVESDLRNEEMSPSTKPLMVKQSHTHASLTMGPEKNAESCLLNGAISRYALFLSLFPPSNSMVVATFVLFHGSSCCLITTSTPFTFLGVDPESHSVPHHNARAMFLSHSDTWSYIVYSYESPN